MQPTFRTDLTCSREEQQGVVFYRIDDPETKTSFRLYEIEYLIAQKLNGERGLPEVIEAVKAEYNFDITEADLQKFISQLESMGFVRAQSDQMDMEAPQPVPMVEVDTTEMPRPDNLRKPGITEASLEMSDAGIGELDQAELTRLLKSAFLHVKQGYLVHARDYLLAAKELNPKDRGLVRLVSSIEVMGDDAGPAEVERLWKQCRELFPDIAEEVGPLMEAQKDGAAAAVAQQARRSNEAWEEDTRSRVRLSGVVIALIVAGIGGVWFAAKKLHVFEGAAKVRVQALQEGTRVPLFHPGGAVGIHPLEEAWTSFAGAGKLSGELPKVGTRVEKGDIIATLELPPPLAKQIKGAKTALAKANADSERVTKNLQKVLDERALLTSQKQAVEEKIKELRPKSVLKQDPASRKELDTLKKDMAKANKKLSALAKRERGPRAAEAKSKKKVDAVQKKIAALQLKIGDKLMRAPFTGEVTEAKAEAGQAVEAKQPLVHLQNVALTKLSFNIHDKGTLQVGGEALVSVQRGNPVSAKVVSVDGARANNGMLEVGLEIADPTRTMLAMPGEAFRLLKEFAEPAFKVRPKALLGDEQHAQLLILQAGHVTRHGVQVLEGQAGDVVVYDPNGVLRSDTQVVLERADGQELNSLADGSAVQAEDSK